MPPKNHLSHEYSTTNPTSLSENQEISKSARQTTCRSARTLCLILALTTIAILLPNQNKPVAANNLKRQHETGNNAGDKYVKNYVKNSFERNKKSWQHSDLLTSFWTPNRITNSIEPDLLLASEPQSSSVTKSSSSADDPYIVKFRAEISQLRAQYQNQTKDEPVNSSTIGSKTEKTKEVKNQKSSAEPISVASVNRPGYNHGFPPSVDAIVAPKLPPLYSPEYYLPSAFDGYDWPAKGVLTSGYGWRWGRLHQGIDIAAPIGTPIFAAASGKVISAGWDSGGYGNLIKIQHLDGSVTVYGHINKIMVTSDQKVLQGQQIAEMGSTGRSTGSHLHFEIRPQGDFAANPMTFLSSK